MSPFREALKAAGHGEWVIEMCSASGDVRLRKIDERALEVHLPIAPSTEDDIVLRVGRRVLIVDDVLATEGTGACDCSCVRTIRAIVTRSATVSPAAGLKEQTVL